MEGLKTATSQCWIPVNAHTPKKDGTIFSHFCVFMCTGKNISKKGTCRREFIFLKKKKKSPFSKEGALNRAFKLGVKSEIFSLSRVARCSLQEKGT